MGGDLTYVLLDAVAFVAGAALSVMLGLMQWRVDRKSRRVSGYLLLWLLGFIWTFGNFLRCALYLAGAAPDSAEARFAEALAWSGTLLGPVDHRTAVAGSHRGDEPRVAGFLAFSIAMSCVNLGLFLERGPALRRLGRGQRIPDHVVLHRAGSHGSLRWCSTSSTARGLSRPIPGGALVVAGGPRVHGHSCRGASCSACSSPACLRTC